MHGEVPTGWAEVRLEELLSRIRRPVEVESDATYRELGIRSHGRGIFLKPEVTGADLGTKRVFHVVPDALIANIVFSWEGALARTTTKHVGLIASHRFPMWLPKPGASLDYLDHLLRSPTGVELAARASPGGAGRNRTLNQTDFLKSKVVVPPLPEQKKIAAILSSVDEAIQATQAVIEQTRRVKEGLLQDLLTRGIGHTRFKQTELGEIPESWEIRSVGDLVSNVVAGKSPTAVDQPASGDNWGVLKVSAVGHGHFVASENKTLPAGFNVRGEHAVRAGDVLITRANTAALVGACCRVPEGEFRLMLCDKTLRLESKPVVRPAFLYQVVGSPRARRYFGRVATGSSASMKNLSQKKIKALLVAVPGLDEQEAIAERLGLVDAEVSSGAARLASLHQVKAGLLQDLLTGKVRVSP